MRNTSLLATRQKTCVQKMNGDATGSRSKENRGLQILGVSDPERRRKLKIDEEACSKRRKRVEKSVRCDVQ